jgi:hypothetical protein
LTACGIVDSPVGSTGKPRAQGTIHWSLREEARRLMEPAERYETRKSRTNTLVLTVVIRQPSSD